MRIEHLIYSLAIALVFGALYYRLRGKDYYWIIVASAFAPDLDLIVDPALKVFGITLLVSGTPIVHGDFHNILVMILYAAMVAFLLLPLGIKFQDSFIFALVGFAAHLFVDALSQNPAYPFFYPLSSQYFGIGLFDYHADLFRIADRWALIFGLALLALAFFLRREILRR
ncbi:MAG: metal-dependent hydrolase [Methanotrichaceae archaeon]|nr:metal-dependent hydrolase [Methanotrichaceae archaeon]